MCDDKCNARGCNSVAQNGNVNASTAISPANARYVPAAVAASAVAAKDRAEFGDLLFRGGRT